MRNHGKRYAAFNNAAYKLRGYMRHDPAEAIPDQTIIDVQRMIHRFNPQFVRMMDRGIDPAFVAEALTNQWWDVTE